MYKNEMLVFSFKNVDSLKTALILKNPETFKLGLSG